MKNIKTIVIAAGVISTCFFTLLSFKSKSGDGGAKTILVSTLNGKGEDNGFMITYSDGKIEKIPFTSKIKVMDPGTWVDAQAQATIILNDMRNKGYRFTGTATIYGVQAMVLEKE